MFAIIAFIPIIVTIIVMAGFNWPAKIALPAGVAHYSRCMLLRMADGFYYNCSTRRIRIPYIH